MGGKPCDAGDHRDTVLLFQERTSGGGLQREAVRCKQLCHRVPWETGNVEKRWTGT